MNIQAASCVASRLLTQGLASSAVLQLGSFKFLGALAGISARSHALPAHHLQYQLQQQATHAASYTSSSAHRQQQQQQEGKGASGSSGSNPGDGQRPTPNEQAQQMSKAFLTNVLDLEELWLKGVAGQLKMWAATKKLELEDTTQAAVVEAVRTEYLDTLQRAAAGRELSNRARSHLKQACLAAATHRVLLEQAPHAQQSVEEFISYSMGGVYSSFMLGGLKLSNWAKRVLLRESSVSQAVDTLHTIARDMEGACHCSVQPLSADGDSDDNEELRQQQQDSEQQQPEDPEAAAEAEAKQHHRQQQWQFGAALTVDNCMIAEVLQQEGVPQLLRYFCCQHNMTWLAAYKGQGVDSKLEACIGKGDACCRISVTPVGVGSD